MATFSVVIPARHASTRLPGKPLMDIAGLPMVVHVARRARASGATDVCVATDHPEIADAVRRHGFDAEMTAAEHPSGTDRIAEVARKRAWPDDRIVVNVQGDEPLIEPTAIERVAATLESDPQAAIATLCCPITDHAEFLNPNVVKVVLTRQGHALYFSRASIPFPRDAFRDGAARLAMNLSSDLPAGYPPNLPSGLPRDLPPGLPAYRHIGLYAYRTAFLHTYAQLEPSELERFEALEQLRALWHGMRIAVAITEHAPLAGVDTAADLERVRAYLQQR